MESIEYLVLLLLSFFKLILSFKLIFFENLIWGRCWVIVNILVIVGLGKYVIVYIDYDWFFFYFTCCNFWLISVVILLNFVFFCDFFDLRVLKFLVFFLVVYILVFFWKIKFLIFFKFVWENVKDLIKKFYFCLIYCSVK